MSYRGRIQKLCRNRHLSVFDCYREESECQHCDSEEFIWENQVNDTNEVGENWIDLEIDEIKRCRVCRLILEKTYKVPRDKK